MSEWLEENANAKGSPRWPWHALLLLAGVFLIHATAALVGHQEELIWDEGRYVECAQLYLGLAPDSVYAQDFVNGPGYPIVLMPFVKTQSLLAARLLNALLMTGAALFLWQLVRGYAGSTWAGIGALWVGLHPALLRVSFALMTEPLSLFCFCGFLWAFCRALRADKRSLGWLLAAAAFLGWLTLTRVFFGHVMTAMTALSLALWPFFKAWRPALQRTLLILIGAFLICLPYLHHTWKVTGQFPCWSTNSGELLYWMTSHHPGENGHWFSYEDAQNDPHLAPQHAAFYQRALALPVAEREALFKQAIREQFDAKAFAYNWLCNLSRLAFGFPRSFQTEELRTVLLVLWNGPLIALSVLAGALALWHWREFPIELLLLLAMAAFYLGGTSLAPGLPRYFAAITPALVLGSAYAWQRYAWRRPD